MEKQREREIWTVSDREEQRDATQRDREKQRDKGRP